MQSEDATHEMLLNWPPPLGVGLGTIDHEMPSHDSTSVGLVPGELL
jgi:hypothetical protein